MVELIVITYILFDHNVISCCTFCDLIMSYLVSSSVHSVCFTSFINYSTHPHFVVIYNNSTACSMHASVLYTSHPYK